MFFHLQRAKRFTEDVARFYLSEIVLALAHVHDSSGRPYGLLVPEKMLLDSEGHVRLSAWQWGEEGRGKGMTYGAVEYLPPEVLEGREMEKASDWWSLGVLLFELKAGGLGIEAIL